MLRAGVKAALGMGGYVGSVALTAAGGTGGEWQLAEHWPMLVLLVGGLGALWMGGKQLISLYDAFLARVDARATAAVAKAIDEHTKVEEQRFATLIQGQQALHDQLQVLIEWQQKNSPPGTSTPTVIPAFKNHNG